MLIILSKLLLTCNGSCLFVGHEKRMLEAFVFFFQAEDGIRDHCVTGVQTCALPIFPNPGKITGWKAKPSADCELGVGEIQRI